MTNVDNIVPLTNKNQELEAELIKLTSFKEEYFKQTTLKEEELLTVEQAENELRTILKDNELAFVNEQEALIFATELLKMPENENVSHYQMVPNLSRKALFFSLIPVLKENATKKQIITPSETLSRSVHLMSINKEINRIEDLLNK